MSRLVATVLALAAGSACAGPWEIAEPMEVTGRAERLFHHLESSGRRSVAVSGSEVAVVWEDDRDGTPRVYLARKPLYAGTFTEVRVSGAGEAFAPSVAALADGRFLAAWEEDGQVFARLAEGSATRLSAVEASQASLVARGDGAVVAYAERTGRFGQIRMCRVQTLPGGDLKAAEPCPVDPAPPADEQLYPAVAFSGDRLVVAWEDRRPRHTVIMAAVEGVACDFSRPQRISERAGSAGGTARAPFGAGTGVARVALDGYGIDGVFAAWADKRSFRNGYDIWGADLSPARRRFGENVQVQDPFGELAAQWDPSVAGHPDGTLVVAWADGREGNADVMLSWREAGEWSDDTPLPGASGTGEQTHPSIVLDAAGNLHAVWIERAIKDGPTRLRYAFGRRVGAAR